ncbi:hypothetical protein O181_001494 [Austropuccinia psidii MF-1]|uniref:Extracellular serine-rich protein n=1 Tax=Austropuccinia psidii MF-1 TaxID=1389203 RepID=A0A9Q3BAM0_9BASI|nr:hypothetical protein [Austropuccinia psidii MF-1]
MNNRFLGLVALLVHPSFGSDFRVTVGISQLTGQVGTGFDPNRIVPTAGDTITFSWLIPSYISNPPTGSYSVTQGNPNSPCQPLSGGFDSGPKTTGPESAGQAPTIIFQVKDTQPLYFYSSVGDQCKQGMVLGVNTPASGAGSVESYIIAAGGNPNADTSANFTTNATSSASPPTSNNMTMANNATHSSNISQSVNQTVAKPKNSAATVSHPETLAALACMFAVIFA